MYYDNEKFLIHKNSMPKEIGEVLSTLNLYDNNINGTIAHLRDTFLDVEREYVMEVLNNEEILEKIREFNIRNAEELYAIAQYIIEKVDNNLIPYNEMYKYEQILIVLLSAIQDETLSKQKILLPSKEKMPEKSRQ